MNQFDHIWAGKAYKSPLAQRVANLFPDWSLARLDEASNFHTLLGDLSLSVGDSTLKSLNLLNDTKVNSADLYFQGHVFTHVIPPSFLFQTYDLDTEYDYVTPIVKGIIGANTYILEEVKERRAGRIYDYPPKWPLDPILSESLPLPTPLLTSGIPSVLEGTELIVPFESKIILEVNNGIDPIVDFAFNNPPIPEVTLTNVRYPSQQYKYNFISNGVYENSEVIPAGTYTINTYILEDTVLLSFDVYHFATIERERNYKYHRILDSSLMFYRLDESDTSYLEVLSYAGTGTDRATNTESYWVEKAIVLLDELGASHEGKSIAKVPLAPYLFVLSNEQPNLIHLYDIYLGQPQGAYLDNETALLELAIQTTDYRIGDTIKVKTRRNLSFTSTPIYEIRMKVTDSLGTTYIDRQGNTVSEALSWIKLGSAGNSAWKEIRWDFVIPSTGTFRFEVDIIEKPHEDPKKGGETVFYLMGKEPIASFSYPALPYQLEAISIRPDGNVYALGDNGSIYKLPFLYGVYYLEYTDYLAYTLSEFDNLTLEY